MQYYFRVLQSNKWRDIAQKAAKSNQAVYDPIQTARNLGIKIRNAEGLFHSCSFIITKYIHVLIINLLLLLDEYLIK